MSYDLAALSRRHALVHQDQRFTCKVAHHDRGVLLKIIEDIGDAVGIQIGKDCTIEEFCEIIRKYQRDSLVLEWKEDA